MAKKSNDMDDVFTTLKTRHRRLFIHVINERFGKNYPDDAEVQALPNEGVIQRPSPEGGGGALTRKRISDYLIRIGGDVYLLECQSGDDGSMAIRIAEYSVMHAISNARHGEGGRLVLDFPGYAVIYVKSTPSTPRRTEIRVNFPGGQSVDYDSENILLSDYTREEIMEKRLYVYVPYYMLRYEKDIEKGRNTDAMVDDLEFFRDGLVKDCSEGRLTNLEVADIREYVNKIIKHMTDGNESEERLVRVMGGMVIETEADRINDAAEARGIAIGEARGIAIGEARGITIGEARGITIGEAKGETNGIRKLEDAMGAAMGGCDTVEDLENKGFSREIAESAIRMLRSFMK